MATWIVHLRIAENLLNRIPNLDVGQFSIGNTAPDSGVPDENWENFDPPSNITHFLSLEKEWDGSADIDFYQNYLAEIDPVDDKERFSFRLGYFFHLVTDNLWRTKIFRPTKERFPVKFDADPKFIWEVKEDWYGLDLIYVRDYPESLFWRVFLDAEPDACDLDFLPIDAVKHQLHHIKTFYQRQDEEVQASYRRPYIYLSQQEVDDFVADVTETLYRIYQVLWIDKVSVLDEKSILSTIS